MRLALVAFAVLIMFSAPASACRGLWEYPQTMAKLASLDMESAIKAALAQRLKDGFDQHERARVADDRDQMLEAVKLLDQIKVDIGR